MLLPSLTAKSWHCAERMSAHLTKWQKKAAGFLQYFLAYCIISGAAAVTAPTSCQELCCELGLKTIKVGNCCILTIGSVGEEKWMASLVNRSQPQVVAIEITYIMQSRLLRLCSRQRILSFGVKKLFYPPSRNWLTQRTVSILYSNAAIS